MAVMTDMIGWTTIETFEKMNLSPLDDKDVEELYERLSALLGDKVVGEIGKRRVAQKAKPE